MATDLRLQFNQIGKDIRLPPQLVVMGGSLAFDETTVTCTPRRRIASGDQFTISPYQERPLNSPMK